MTMRAAAIHVPHRVKPGTRVRIAVAGFPAGSRVRVQFARFHHPPCNCDATVVLPRLSKPALQLGPEGQRVLHVRMPPRYARCVTNACPRPDFTRFRSGQPVTVTVFSQKPSTYVLARSRVR
jgi:hypothetical protein